MNLLKILITIHLIIVNHLLVSSKLTKIKGSTDHICQIKLLLNDYKPNGFEQQNINKLNTPSFKEFNQNTQQTIYQIYSDKIYETICVTNIQVRSHNAMTLEIPKKTFDNHQKVRNELTNQTFKSDIINNLSYMKARFVIR
jgi:hypothetical protein